MKQIFVLKGLDCPHCSAEIEREVGALRGIRSASVNLMRQTLTVDVEATESPLSQITAIIHSHEPEITVTEYAASVQEEDDSRVILVRLAVGAAVFVAGLLCRVFAVRLTLLILAYLLLGGDVLWKAARNIVKGRVFDENFLMSLSTVGAFAIGEYPEAVAVMLFYQMGEFFQELSVKRSRRSIAALMDIRPDVATVLRGGERVVVPPEEVAVGETIVVKPGERVPIDGVVLAGESALDTRALTGETVPRTVRVGDTVLSGSINQRGVLTVAVTKPFGESTASKILELVENAAANKASTENFITTFARYYTPAVVVLAALLAVIPPLFVGGWSEWLRRGLVFLVISCPCALVISIPLTFFGGIGAASKHGVLVKGSNYLEALGRVSTVVFDKTGTLTRGVFKVTAITPGDGFTADEVLAYAAAAEQESTHPIAASVRAACPQSPMPEGCEELAGRGIAATVNGHRVLAGSARLMQDEGVSYTPCEAAGTQVYVAVDGAYAGCILIADELKPDSKAAVAALKRNGVQQTAMLTGDDEHIARAVAEELGVDTCFAGLLPDQKVQRLELLDREKRPGSKLVFVGDGINDAPVLARADIGIAMGGVGSDAAIEAADVVLMTDEPAKLVEAITIAKATKRIVVQNIVIAIGIKALFLMLGAVGIAGMWEAVFADVGVALIAVGNAMRIMKR